MIGDELTWCYSSCALRQYVKRGPTTKRGRRVRIPQYYDVFTPSCSSITHPKKLFFLLHTHSSSRHTCMWPFGPTTVCIINPCVVVEQRVTYCLSAQLGQHPVSSSLMISKVPDSQRQSNKLEVVSFCRHWHCRSCWLKMLQEGMDNKSAEFLE